MGGAVAVRGLRPGLASRAFSARELLAAAAAPDARTVVVGVDGAGLLACTGGGAALAARARLAAGAARAAAEVARAGAGLRVRVLRAVPPLHELLLWPAADLLPALPPNNSHDAGSELACPACGERFEEPDVLHVHRLLRCGAREPAALWRSVAERLAAPPASAFRRVPAAPARATPLPALPAPAAAHLEALCAEWGRRGAGHACLYCGKLYSRKYGLKIHIRTHTGYRPLRCRHCARAFGDPSNLNKHVRLHAAERGAHTCARCGRRHARRRDLERHQRAPCAPPAPPEQPTSLALSEDGSREYSTGHTLHPSLSM